MKFEDLFEEAVREAFSTYGLVGPVMIKDIESKAGVKASKWWKKPEKVEEAVVATYGEGGRSILKNILFRLSERLPDQQIDFSSKSFGEAVTKLVQDLKRAKRI